MGKPFGYSYLLDCYGCKPGICDDIAAVYDFLEELVVRLKMTPQNRASVFRGPPGLFPDKAGLSGYQPLIESSLSIHTLAPKNFITLDVYCCKQFDQSIVKDYALEVFSFKFCEENFIPRGLKYYGDQSLL